MSLVVFVLLAALATVVIAYPLFKARVPAPQETGISDAQVERAVRRLREARNRGAVVPGAGELCPACSAPYQPGDRFCMHCGGTLPPQEAAPRPAPGLECASCGAALRDDDLFCARCGQRVPAATDAAPTGESREEVQP
jgi:predicted amidophosphoribosyltransferase